MLTKIFIFSVTLLTACVTLQAYDPATPRSSRSVPLDSGSIKQSDTGSSGQLTNQQQKNRSTKNATNAHSQNVEHSPGKASVELDQKLKSLRK